MLVLEWEESLDPEGGGDLELVLLLTAVLPAEVGREPRSQELYQKVSSSRLSHVAGGLL